MGRKMVVIGAAVAVALGAAGGCSSADESPSFQPSRGGGGAGGDIDCDQVVGTTLVGPNDPHRLDADGDGVGCEPYTP